MTRTTIEFGIDLGTTNSCIARLKGGDLEIIRNNEGFECTPSAVWLDRKNRLHVGRRAREQFETDEENACLEFKLQMGKTAEKVFQRTGQKLKPEELSAEVLKSLLGDARQRYSEEVRAAVITVPADFDLPQCDATRKAAQLAGLEFSPLLQEPVAAALAYGFKAATNKTYWMVYDLGGGTFDAAVIQMRDGVFRVVNHGGDRHLGGKLFDWAIVDQLLVPALTAQYRLSDFRRGNHRWRAAFAKLKLAAEQAKIRLSRDQAAEISLDFEGEGGQRVQFDYDLQRGDVERLTEPFILRTLNICKKVLADKRLAPGDLEKLLLVGGPTLSPYLRGRLTEGLSIPLEFGHDPMTVVAEGAAVFAAAQRLDAPATSAPPAEGTVTLHLEYQPVGADPEPLVGGKVLAATARDFSGYTVEFVDSDARPPRRSGKIPLQATGTFLTNLWSTRGKQTTFMIELRDPAGRQIPTAPDRLTYMLGIAAGDPPLIHSLGVAMANNQLDVFFPKGTSLPARKRVVHRTAMMVRRGQAGEVIRIPVVEGENVRRADRNRLIGSLVIPADKIKRDVPPGSEVEITIEIDSSRLLRTRAYVPVLDEEFEDVIKFNRDEPDPKLLREDVQRERARLQQVRWKADQVRDSGAAAVLQRLDDERVEQDVEAALAAAEDDPDAAEKCQNRLLDLKTAVDEAEKALQWPALVSEAEHQLTSMRDLVREHGQPRHRTFAEALERETRQAMEARDADLLDRKIKEVTGVIFDILRDQPSFWIGYLGYAEERRAQMRDPMQAEQLFARARRAMNENDLPALRAAVQQLIGLLPYDQQQKLQGFGGTTVR